MKNCKIWIEQCEGARKLKDDCGTEIALKYLGDRFLSFLEKADKDTTFRAEIPAFVAEINNIFERGELEEYLDNARQSEPFNPTVFHDQDPEIMERERMYDLRRCANDLWVIERARDWLISPHEEPLC